MRLDGFDRCLLDVLVTVSGAPARIDEAFLDAVWGAVRALR